MLKGFAFEDACDMRKGILLAAAAYLLWGLFPIYFRALADVPAPEMLAHRVLWSVLFLALLLAHRQRWAWLGAALRQPRLLRAFGLSALLLSSNWLVYIWAVNAHRVVDASLGYFMNPLVSILLGAWLLGERLRALQWLAVAIAGLGVGWLVWHGHGFPWIGIVLALSFGFYGLLRKTAVLGTLEGLSLETLLLLPLAAGYLAWTVAQGNSGFVAVGAGERLLLLAAGPVTAVPLLMFAAAARRIPLTTLGLLQYTAPTLQLLIGVWLYGEPFRGARLQGFVIIWVALAVFSAEGLWRTWQRRLSLPAALVLSAIVLQCCLLPGVANAAGDPREQPELHALAAEVSAGELEASIGRLVSFGTRHTLSDTRSPTRGIGAARRWLQQRFATLSEACQGCLEIVTPAQTFTGKRIPQATEVMDVIAIQRGSSDPQRVVLITGHYDSRNSDIGDATGDAPGANDDGSGTAAVLEACRVLSRRHHAATVVYAALAGEEQGLYGGKVLAEYARSQGWQVEADLNNDIIGNTHGQDGVLDNRTVRIFSEGTKAVETPDQGERRRYQGGEVDSPSRNLARFIAGMAESYVPALQARMIYRTDRFGRGGDQVEFLALGFPAVRITEGHENYTRQHQDLRHADGIDYGDVISGVDFAYLANVVRLNAVSLAALAAAPAPPSGVAVDGAVGPDTTVHWKAVPGAAAYRVWWRDTTAARWQFSRLVPADGTGDQHWVLPGIVIDDWFFGVSAVSADGHESPVVFPGETGSFF